MKRESVKIWAGWLESIDNIPDRGSRGELALAIFEYALDGRDYTGSDPWVKVLLPTIRKTIDGSFQNSENGRKGGQRSAEKRNPASSGASTTASTTASSGAPNTKDDNVDDNDNVNDNVDNKKDKNLSSFGVKAKRETPKSFNISSYLESKGVQPAMIEAWLAIRKTKRATNTEAAMQLMEREIGKVKMTWDEVIQECVLRNWVGFKAEWILKDQVQQAAPEGGDDMDAMAKKWRQELEAMRAADGRVPGQFKDL